MADEDILHDILGSFRSGNDLSNVVAEQLLDSMIGASDEELLTKLFVAWKEKGISEDEIFSIAKVMRQRSIKIRAAHPSFVDIVGTGGSSAKSFNVSTAAAFVAAGANIAVAKHGNKAATSNSGSSDVLSALGVEPAVDAATAERCLNEIGICFMYAPNFHRLSSTLAKVRRRLGFPTIFNCVGPLCNPADAPHQIIGVWEKGMASKMANALARLGTKKSWIVYGDDGSDEISISGQTHVAEIVDGEVRTFEIIPADLGIDETSLDDFRAKNAYESAAIVTNVLRSRHGKNAAVDVVTANAAAAIQLVGGGTLADNRSLALESIVSGNALAKLNALVEATRP